LAEFSDSSPSTGLVRKAASQNAHPLDDLKFQADRGVRVLLFASLIEGLSFKNALRSGSAQFFRSTEFVKDKTT
jgi:hypothetical protein